DSGQAAGRGGAGEARQGRPPGRRPRAGEGAGEGRGRRGGRRAGRLLPPVGPPPLTVPGGPVRGSCPEEEDTHQSTGEGAGTRANPSRPRGDGTPLTNPINDGLQTPVARESQIDVCLRVADGGIDMIELFASVCIEAPSELVWARLAKLEDIQLWAEPVLWARCEGSASHGVGAERACRLGGNRTSRERWVAGDEGRSFAYEGCGIPLMQRAVNRWAVVPHGERSLLTSEAELEIKGGVFGRILEPIVAPLMRRMAPNALAGFKYLVEHGHPYAG